MPELPEVETIVRGLDPILRGRQISGYQLFSRKAWRQPDFTCLENLCHKIVQRVWRRGKFILLSPTWGPTLIFHLKMTGRLVWVPRTTPHPKHLVFILNFRNSREELRFIDTRKFGYISCRPTEEVISGEAPELAGLGPEPLEIDLEQLQTILKGRKGRIKSLLLNQQVIAGIGNIYADEILFRAGIHPLRPAHTLEPEKVQLLWQTMRDILQEAIKKRGTSFRDYRDAANRAGNYQQLLQVYGREGKPCPHCGQPLQRRRIGGRSAHFCPRCQK